MTTSDELIIVDRPSGQSDEAAQRKPIAIPQYGALPAAKNRRLRAQGSELCCLSVELQVVTPILGGGFQTRTIDDVDFIRTATIRGHLRFWWRALFAHQYPTAKKLYEQESKLWGEAASEDGGRSAVELQVKIINTPADVDTSDINLSRTDGAYALWPARGDAKGNSPAPRRKSGTRFKLTVLGPDKSESELRDVIRAWILFGGYGSRTRRGLGSLIVTNDRDSWLPRAATRQAFEELFGRDIFSEHLAPRCDTPRLAGAVLHVGNTQARSAQDAWIQALDWLKDFRQGAIGDEGKRAREPHPGDPQRPSVSNWPEPDKVRHLSTPSGGLRWAHQPDRHNDVPAWPRAGFGLPISVQFQQQSRIPRAGWIRGGRETRNLRWNELPPEQDNFGVEPNECELLWRIDGRQVERLASPLIVKAIPLENGNYVPCALWLNREYPKGGEVILRSKKEKISITGSEAPFDRLVAEGDEAHFDALVNKPTLRQAFFDWLAATKKTIEVTR
ncbi:MAG: type III-B CRISPR module RAMP protein Cmr1 [Bradymonadaceae bacterium]|nr:type III-B CRISPR module RAMP protein Cmr1 [Lujinxingiaceae bacterium]